MKIDINKTLFHDRIYAVFSLSQKLNRIVKWPNLLLQNSLFPFDLSEALDEGFPLLTFCLKAADLKPQLLQLPLTDL